MAHIVFFRYTSQHPDFAQLSPPFDKPLLNFVWFLLLLLERLVSFFTSIHVILLFLGFRWDNLFND